MGKRAWIAGVAAVSLIVVAVGGVVVLKTAKAAIREANRADTPERYAALAEVVFRRLRTRGKVNSMPNEEEILSMLRKGMRVSQQVADEARDLAPIAQREAMFYSTLLAYVDPTAPNAKKLPTGVSLLTAIGRVVGGTALAQGGLAAKGVDDGMNSVDALAGAYQEIQREFLNAKANRLDLLELAPKFSAPASSDGRRTLDCAFDTLPKVPGFFWDTPERPDASHLNLTNASGATLKNVLVLVILRDKSNKLNKHMAWTNEWSAGTCLQMALPTDEAAESPELVDATVSLWSKDRSTGPFTVDAVRKNDKPKTGK